MIDFILHFDQRLTEIVQQYGTYMGGVLTGDWGKSLISKRDVWTEIRVRIPLTVELTLLSTVFAILLALPIGIISAVKQVSVSDYVLRIL